MRRRRLRRQLLWTAVLFGLVALAVGAWTAQGILAAAAAGRRITTALIPRRHIGTPRLADGTLELAE